MPFRGKHTAETKERIAAHFRGIPRSEATKARIGESQRGKRHDRERRLAIRIGIKRLELFDPERYQAMRRTQGETMRRLWSEGRYANRKPRTKEGVMTAPWRDVLFREKDGKSHVKLTLACGHTPVRRQSSRAFVSRVRCKECAESACAKATAALTRFSDQEGV
jgi:hypothetical protein